MFVQRLVYGERERIETEAFHHLARDQMDYSSNVVINFPDPLPKNTFSTDHRMTVYCSQVNFSGTRDGSKFRVGLYSRMLL
jgi:hypothetical protein